MAKVKPHDKKAEATKEHQKAGKQEAQPAEAPQNAPKAPAPQEPPKAPAPQRPPRAEAPQEATPGGPRRSEAEEATTRPASAAFEALNADVQSIYEGMREIGATGLSHARTADDISEELHVSKKRAKSALKELEGRGFVGHIQTGSETSYFTK